MNQRKKVFNLSKKIIQRSHNSKNNNHKSEESELATENKLKKLEEY